MNILPHFRYVFHNCFKYCFLPIHFHVMGPKGAKLDDVKSVHSHIHALGQCRRAIRKHGWLPVVRGDTAGSAREIAQEGDKTAAALAPRLAAELYGLYISMLMEGMKLAATAKKNTGVLMRIMGNFRKVLNGDEKKELLEIIEKYRTGMIPLIVPVTLLNHHVRKYSPERLMDQYYLAPHPDELMLRNHV